MILDALSMLHHEKRDFRMVFIGDGIDRPEIEEYAYACGIMDKCVFTGAIHDREVVRAWYCRIDLFLFPSTFDTNGLVVREAAACALPSVLIRSSAAAEGVTDGANGFLIDENAKNMHALLFSLMDNPEKMSAVGQAAGKDLYLSWEASVKMAILQRNNQTHTPVISVILLSPSFGSITLSMKPYMEMVEGRRPPPTTFNGV